MTRSVQTKRGILLALGCLFPTLAYSQVQINITPSSPASSSIVAVNPPSGLSYYQAAGVGEIGADIIANNAIDTVGWNMPAAASNVTISAYVTSGPSITAYLTTQSGAGTTVSNQIATATFEGTSDSTGQPTTIFTGLNLPSGNYYLTLTSGVASNSPTVPFWFAVSNSPGPFISNSAGGVTGLSEGTAATAAPYPPASTFVNENTRQQTGSPFWNAYLFSVTSVQSGALPVATVGTPYSETLTATGGTGPYTWSLPFTQAGVAPAWLSIDPNAGTLSGTPTANGTFTFAVQAKDANNNIGQQTVTLLVNFSGTVITTNLPAGMAIVNVSGTSNTPTVGGNGASNSATANGSSQSIWSAPFNTASQLLEYTLPPGTYTMRVIDPADAAAVFPALTQTQLNSMWSAWTYNYPWITDFLVFDSSAASNSNETQLFSGATGGPGTSGPASAYADAVNGYLSGSTQIPPFDNNLAWQYRNATPQKTMTFPAMGSGPETLIFAVPDSELSDNGGGVSILIAPYTSSPTINTESVPNGQVAVSYSATQLVAIGGSGTYIWSASGLPPGLTLSASGLLSGTPTYTSSYPSVQITVTDPVSGLFSTTPYGITIAAPSPALTISATGAPLSQGINQGEFGVTYNQPLTATGGYGAYTWSIYSGNAGPLSINPSTGVLSSSGPLSGGNGSNFYVKVQDAAGDSYITPSPGYTLLVDGAVTISTSSLPNAAVGESWSTTLVASGGTTVYTWSATGLPSWLSISATGVLSGIPPAAGVYPANVTVTDSAGGTKTTTGLNLTVTLPVGYVVLNSSAGGLVSVSGDGSTVVSSTAVNGIDMAQDAGGNAVVATGTQLVRVTPLGDSTALIATAPSGSSWVAVAVDGMGNLIVGDNIKHGVWRISPDGVTQVFVTTYPIATSTHLEDIRILVDVHGNYIVAEDGGSVVGIVSLFSITPAGVVTTVTLSPHAPEGVNGMTFDQNGNYMLLDQYQLAVFRITPQGNATELVGGGGVPRGSLNPGGLARNPLTNQYVTVSSGNPGKVDLISADGSTVTTLASSADFLSPSGVIALTEDFPSTVDATNPLGYFRLETASGVSETNGTSFTLNGAATVVGPGAPIGAASDNYASLDGSSAYVSTGLTGGIGTAGSMMAWVNLATLPSTAVWPFSYIAGESSQANDFDLQFNSSNVLGFYTTCCGNSLSYTPNSNTLVGQWHMIVATFDATAGTRAIYWDGALVASDNCPSCSSYTNKTGTFWIGNTSNYSNFGNRFFPGGIDEVAVWNYALTGPQVYRMYASRPPASTGIVTSLAPASSTYGASSATLTVNGSGFSSNCDGPCPNVWFTAPGGQTTVLTPSSFGSSQISVTIPGAQLTTSGPAEISFVNSAGVPSNELPFTIPYGPLSISLSTTTLATGQTNTPYSQGLTASGGTGSYSWSITSQATGLNLSLSALTGTSVSLIGTPTVATTDGGLQITVQVTDTSTQLTQSQTYFINVARAIPTATQPSGTTAYIIDENGSLISVTGGTPVSLVSGTGCNACYDIARDSSGNFIIAAGNQLTRYTSGGAVLAAGPVSALNSDSSYFQSVAIDSGGNYIVADSGLGQIVRISPGTPGTQPVIATFPATGNAYVRVDAYGNYVLSVDNSYGNATYALSLFLITPPSSGAANCVTLTSGCAVIPINAGDAPAPASTGGLTFDASGNYIDVDWSNEIIYTITPSGATTPLYTDTNGYLSDPEGIYRDPASGVFFLVDDNNNALYTFASDGSNFGQVVSGGLLATSPGSVVVVDTGASGQPLTFNPPAGTLVNASLNQAYTLALIASGGSGNYSWSISNQSSGLNLSLGAATGTTVSLRGTPTVLNSSPGSAITVTLTDTITTLTTQQTYTIPVSQPDQTTTWNMSGIFNDGGALSGTFTLDTTQGTVANWNLVASGGSTLVAFTYTPANSTGSYNAAGGSNCPGPCVTFISNAEFPDGGSPPLEENRILDLSFLAPLIAGNTVALYIDNSNNTASHECLDCSPYRLFTQGGATSLAPGATDYVLQSGNFTIEAIGSGSSVSCSTNICPTPFPDLPNDIALDASGNFIVATTELLVKITSAGVSSLISTATPSYWQSVAVDSSGYYIVADNVQHRIVRISPSGTVVPVANYPAPVNELEGVVVRIDSQGNYIVAEDNGGFHLYRITPSGTVTAITLTGTVPRGAGGLAFDANGNYVIDDYGNAVVALITISSPTATTGVASVLYSNPNHTIGEPVGIYRDPVSGNYLIADRTGNSLYSLNSTGTALALVASGLATPVAVVSVSSSPLAITTSSLSSGMQGQAYTSVTLTASGGTGGYTWTATGLPSGLILSTGGLLSGTPGASGVFTVHVTVTDSSSNSQTANLSLTITAPSPPPPPPGLPPLFITTSSLPNGTVGVAYSAGLAAFGGSGNYSWFVSGLPPGLGAGSSGAVSGTPTAVGTFSVGVFVSDSTANMSAQATVALTIGYGPLTLSGTANLGGFAPSAAISASYSASGGAAPYKWSANGLPAGLTIDPASGKLTGSIAKPGNYSFTIQVTDSEPVSTTLNVNLFVLGIATTSLPAGTNKIPYSQTLAATGGNPPPYSWTVTSGSLPPGLTLSGSGVLSGTPVLTGAPTSAQTFAFGVSLTCSGVTVSTTLSVSITLTAQPLSISGSSGNSTVALPDGLVQTPYSQALSASGGIPPYTWSVLGGGLPDGVSLSSGGTISGTPARVGSFAFTAQASDTSGGTSAAGFAITIDPPAFTITTPSPLSNGIAGTSYPLQVFTASGGIEPYNFVEQGGLPPGLTFSGGTISGTPTNVGTSSFTVTATDSSQPTPLTASAEYQIGVTPAHTDLVLSESSLQFSFNAGATGLPSGTSNESISVSSNATQTLGYSVTVTPAVSWLDVSAGSGITPGAIGVSLDPKALSLPAGASQTSITVTCVTPAGGQPSPCAGNSQTINVSLVVTNVPPALVASPDLLSFTAQTSNLQSSSESLILQNAGGGTITVNSITSGSSFVSFTGVPTSIPASGTVPVGVVVNPAGLAVGYYESTILVNTSVGSASVPVILLVSQNATMTLAPSGSQFQMLAGSSPGQSSGSFLVDVNSGSAVSWNATVLSGATWLQLNTTSGSSTSASPETVSFSINPAIASTLSPQVYYGTIQVTSGAVTDSTQSFLVVLNVVAGVSSVQPDPEPAGLVFFANGSAILPPQSVRIFSSSPSAGTYSASSDSPWLQVSTGSGSVSDGSPGFSTVSANQSGLKPGVYRGTVSYQFTGSGASSAVRGVSVTLVVEGATAVPGARKSGDALPQQNAGCTPSQLVPTQTGLVNSFAQPASWPTPLTIQLSDDCANPVTNGQIIVTFSNGDPPLQLARTDATSGNYSGTWTPRNTAAQITINARATASGFPAATAQLAGQVIPNATPILSPNGTLNAFSSLLGAAIAPGTIVQIYGEHLAGQSGVASAIPLPTKLNSTSVLIGGKLAPLYYVSPGQINAQVPFELNAGQQYQVIVNANGAYSTPNPIQLSADAPGVVAFPTGQIIATHLDNSLVQETSPAAPGEVIVFYAAGMGATNQDIADGAASPSTNPAVSLDPPAITVGGIAVTNILFAGLTPTLVGLYQVDFQVPATAPNGDLELVMTQSSGQSTTAVLPVHN